MSEPKLDPREHSEESLCHEKKREAQEPRAAGLLRSQRYIGSEETAELAPPYRENG